MRFTFVPTRKCFPGFGFWAITRPFRPLEYLLATLPGLQCAFVSASFAALSLLPFSLGTMHASLLNLAVTERARLIVTRQDRVPEQAPDQPEKTEPEAGVGISVTLVP